ncbi:MAG: FAD-dependent thymidylate synthase [Bdellovibrionota bacterium]
MEEEVKLVSITPKAEETMAYCARVSNPDNQLNPEVSGLLGYCVKHGHWSVFEQANLIIEINTSRAVAPQILRHRSFSFQEFSQRYSAASSFVPHKARRQAKTNRQSSIDDLDTDTQGWFQNAQNDIWELAFGKYVEALEKGIAKESARALLPLNTATRLYMNGTVRSWIHYIQLRAKTDTQEEHRKIAEACRGIFIEKLPLVSKALGWA